MAFHPLNSKQKKELLQDLIKYFGLSDDFKEHFDYALFVSDDDKYYCANRDVEEFLGKGLRIERIGVYLGQYAHKEFRLSIEGSQLLGPYANETVFEITLAERDEWMLGRDLVLPSSKSNVPQRFHIIKCGSDFLGCGKIKNGIIHNYVPKERYVGATFPNSEQE